MQYDLRTAIWNSDHEPRVSSSISVLGLSNLEVHREVQLVLLYDLRVYKHLSGELNLDKCV